MLVEEILEGEEREDAPRPTTVDEVAKLAAIVAIFWFCFDLVD